MRGIRLTIKDIESSACGHLNQHLFQQAKKKKAKPGESKIGGRRVLKHFPKKSEELNLMEMVLIDWTQRNCVELYEEYRFCEERGWRFDWSIPSMMVAIEYEGLMSEKSGHTTVTGYSKDTEKYNTAAQLGWTVYRYTALTYKTLIYQLNALK